jgi:effector-binding domain-containing protein
MKRFILLTVSILLAILIFVCSQQLDSLQGKIIQKKVHNFYYVILVHRGSYSDWEQVTGNFFSEIDKQNITTIEPVLGFYYNDPAKVKPEELEWGIGAMVADSLQVKKPLLLAKWDIHDVLSYDYNGNPDSTGYVYRLFDKYMAEKNLAPAGPAVERYLNFGTERDSLRIEIWFPYQKI